MKHWIRYVVLFTGIIVIFIGMISAWSNGGIDSIDELGNIRTNRSFSVLFLHVVIGVGLIGMSEIIHLLQKLVHHFTVIPDEKEFEQNESVINKPKDSVAKEIKDEIIDFYAAQSITVEQILPTTLEDFYVVVRGDKKELIEVGGFFPMVVSRERLDNSYTLRKLLE